MAKRFTLIQIASAPEWAGERDRQGQRAFSDRTCSQWNPAYWQSFERRVQRANEQGLAVLLVGLMEPVHRYPQAPQACLFARNIVARLFGNFVIFSPSFDSDITPLANEVGRAARDATAVLAAMPVDKKRRGGGLRFVVPGVPGRVEVVEHVPTAVLEAVVRHVCAASGD